MNMLNTLDFTTWQPQLSAQAASACTQALELGQVAYLPQLSFVLAEAERKLLSPQWLDGNSKNISYDPNTGKVKHTSAEGADAELVTAMMSRFSNSARSLVESLFPAYSQAIRIGMTSYRPVEAEGRNTSSIAKDDHLLHVDAFVSRPTGGHRILRVFSNINPEGKPREWVLGTDPFEVLAKSFVPRISSPLPGTAWLMKTLGLTKGLRTLYDHYMLQMHDRGKEDSQYQTTCAKTEVSLPAQTTWAVYTDSVSHAVLSGQYLLEQTFYLPVEAMQDPARSPLRILEKLLGKKLV